MAAPTDALILSVSRDKTAVSWARPAPTASFAREAVFQAGAKYVNALSYIPPTPDAPKGMFCLFKGVVPFPRVKHTTNLPSIRLRRHWRRRHSHQCLRPLVCRRGARVQSHRPRRQRLCAGLSTVRPHSFGFMGQVRSLPFTTLLVQLLTPCFIVL